MKVIPTSCWIRLSSTCICLRSFRSSAPSGSSRSRTAGRLISARASATRCAWPARDLRRLARLEARELDEGEHLPDPGLHLAVLDALATQPEGDVLVDRQVRKERVVLEDRVDVPPVGRQPRHVLAMELDQSGRRLFEAADHPQGGRLAAAGGTEEAEELGIFDLEVDVVDGDHITELLDDVGQPDLDRHGRVALLLTKRDAFPPFPTRAARRWGVRGVGCGRE